MAGSLHELPAVARTAVFGLLSLLVTAGAWQALVGPLATEISETRSRLAGLEGEALQAQLAALRLPAVQQEVQALEAALRRTEALTRKEQGPQDVLRSLQELASESLLDIARFTPGPAVARGQHTEWPMELGLEGRYHDLGRFLDRVAGMAQVLLVSDLRITAQARPTGRGTVSASCVATAFVFEGGRAGASGDPR